VVVSASRCSRGIVQHRKAVFDVIRRGNVPTVDYGIVFGFMKAFCIVHQAFTQTCSNLSTEPFLVPLVQPCFIEHPWPCCP
jgi:hypothetical protein